MAASREQNLQLSHQEYDRRETVLESYPSRVQIGTDNRCNMRCPFCLASAFRQVGRVHLQDQHLEQNPLELFQRLVPYMKYWEFLSLTGPGESLINPRLPEILALIRGHTDCHIVVTTNGVLIDAKLARTLVDNRVQEVSVSLDSLDPKLYPKLRVNGTLKQALDGISHLQEASRQAANGRLEISLAPTFHRLNIEELPNFIDFAHRSSIPTVQASPLQVYREDWVEHSLLHFPKLTRQIASRAESRARELGVNLINNLRMVYVNRGRGPLGRFKPPEKIDFSTDPSTCRKPWDNLYVEPDGEVRPCCHQSPIYGNLYKTEFKEIWNGAEATLLRRQMVTGDLPDACRECYEFNRHDPSVMIQLLE